MKVISGGQTGADEAGLFAGQMMGYETGGHAPNTFRTVHGPNLELKTKYNLIEDESYNYQPRTLKNVKNSDCTIRLAVNFQSPGERLTLRYINKLNKPYFDVNILKPPEPRELALWIHRNGFETINVAGNANRGTKTDIFDFVSDYLLSVFGIVGELS